MYIYNYQLIDAIKKLENEIKSHAGKDSIKNYLLFEYNPLGDADKRICLYKTDGLFTDDKNNKNFKTYFSANSKVFCSNDEFYAIVPVKQLLESLKLYDKNSMVQISIDENYEMTKKYCQILDDTKLEKQKTLRNLDYSYLYNRGNFTVKTICFIIDGCKINFISQEGRDEILKNIFQDEERIYEIIE